MKSLICLALLNCFAFWAQNPYSIHYSLEEGLPTSNIYSAFEDYQGYMWFSTDVGVLRYDGYDFKHFNTDDGLGDNEVFKIVEDSQKRLWFLSLNGKLSYLKDGKFHNIKTSAALKVASHHKMLVDIHEDHNSDLYFMYRDGNFVQLNSELKAEPKQDIHKATYGIASVGTSLYALSFDTFYNLKTEEKIEIPKHIRQSKGYRLYNRSNSTVFASEDRIFELKNGKVSKLFSIENEEIIFITEIQNKLFLGTRNGLYIKSKNQISHLFKGQVVSSICKDSFEGFWMTTLNSGIFYMPNFRLQHVNDFGGQKVNTIYRTGNGHLHVGTSSGVFRRKAEEYKFSKYLNIQNEIKKIKTTHDESFLFGKDSTYIVDSNRIEKFPVELKDMEPIGDDMLLATSVVMKVPKDQLSKVNYSKNSSTIAYRVFMNRTHALLSLKDSILLGTSSGLYSLKNERFQEIVTPNEALNSSVVELLYDDNSDRLLVATNSKGLAIFEDGKYKRSISKQSGLLSNVCNAIAKIEGNVYLVGTNTGINQLTIANEGVEIKNLNALLHLQNARILDLEPFDNQLYFVAKNQLYKFPMEAYEAQKTSPRLILNPVLVNDSVTSTSELRYDQNDITISYTGLYYASFGNIEYQYKWENEDHWTTTNSRQLNFNALSPGNYSLLIRAVVNKNYYSAANHIRFTIKPPFWQNSWFLALLLVLGFLVTVQLIRREIKRIKSKYEDEQRELLLRQERIALEKQMIELERKAMQLQMNPHFIFNALNTIKGYYTGGNLEEANMYISKFSKLLRNVLESDRELISLGEELKMLNLYTELMQLRYKNLFEYTIEVSDDINTNEVGVPPLLFQPIVENAIRHGLVPLEKGGKLCVNFKVSADKLVGIIEDNGIGYSKSKMAKQANEYESKALQLTRDRIQFTNEDYSEANFNIKDRIPSGTRVEIRLPLVNLWN